MAEEKGGNNVDVCDRCGVMKCSKTGSWYMCSWLWAIMAARWIRSYEATLTICATCCDHGTDRETCAKKCTVGYELLYVEKNYPEALP